MRFARLKTHDYRGEGYYFITFATAPRRALLSEIRDGRIQLFPEGRAVVEAWQRIPADDPAYSLRINVVMPDHFHGILVCKGGARYSLSQIVERMKARSRQTIRRLKNAPALSVWEAGFHDFVAFTSVTFNVFSDYVRDNPRRWQLRQDNPQWFAKQTDVVHPRLPPETQWTAYGDRTLLDYPWLEPVIISRRLEGEELEAEVARFLELAREGAVLIGGFISPGERRVAREAAAISRSRLIYLHPWGLSRYKPHGHAAAERLASGLTLALSGFPDTEEAVPRRENCLCNNRWAQAIALTSSHVSGSN